MQEQTARFGAVPPTPARSHRRRRSRVPWLVGLLLLVLLLGGGLYAIAPLRHPPPAATVAVGMPASMTIPGSAPQLPWPRSGQAMIAVDGLGTLGRSGGSQPLPIGSVAKVMTAYVILTGHPLAAGQPGPTLTVSAERAAAYPAEVAREESLVPVRAGEALTERQALQALLLPSANNIARVLAEWDAGSEAAFVQKMNATATQLGMSGTRYTDSPGFDPRTVSTAADQLILAGKAMALPAFAEIAQQQRATLPIAGEVRNFNELVGHQGVVGIKTGSTDQAGGCLVFAAVLDVGGRKLRILGAVLGQPGLDTPAQLDKTFAVTRSLLQSTASALAIHTLVRAGDPVATVRGPFGARTTLNAAGNVDVPGWPGMQVRLHARIPPVTSGLAAGAVHGELTLSTGDGATGGGELPATVLRTGAGMQPPSTWERIRHHG